MQKDPDPEMGREGSEEESDKELKRQRGEAGAWEREGKTSTEKERDTKRGTRTETHRGKKKREEDQETHRDRKQGRLLRRLRRTQGPPPRQGGDGRRQTHMRKVKPAPCGRAGGLSLQRSGGSRAERGKEGRGRRREGEGGGGAGRARGAGRKRGGAAGRGPPEKRPNFLPRQSQEAGAGTPGPGSPSPTSGAPPVTSPRGHQVHSPWPRPASLPSAARGSGEEEGGGWALPAVKGPPPGPAEPAGAPPWASVFPSVKGDKERRTNTCSVPSR